MIINDFNTVIVVSTINSLYGSFSPESRFQHTIDSINSVIENIPGAKILFIDNSNIPIKSEWKEVIESKVDVFHQLQHNLFSLSANMKVNTKSESEANMLHTAFNLLIHHNLVGKRIFKISGRYSIKGEFDISLYDDPKFNDKYSFVPSKMALSEDGWITQRTTMWFEQALISFSPSNLEEFKQILMSAIGHMRRTGDCIEETLFYFIPHEKVIAIDKAHVYGIKAEGRQEVDK